MSSIIKVNTIQDTDGNNIINESGNVITIGASGDTITVPAGATVSGFTSAGIDDNATSVAITIDSSERVGIGSTAPGTDAGANADSLVIKKTSGNVGMSIITDGSSNANIFLGDTSDNLNALVQFNDSANELRVGTSNGGGDLVLKSGAGVEALRIDDTGRVGIGTSSPSTSLHISQSQPIITLTDTDTSVSHQLSGQSGSSHFNLKVDTGGSSGSPVFNLSMQDSIKLSVLNDGNVGIGTTTPSRTLDVAGIVRSSTAFALGGNTSTPAEGSAIYRPASDNLAFVTNNNERARFDSSGRFLLAKTSTAIGDVGISLDSNGKISATRSSDPVFLLNRLSSDGTIADFRKDGTTVGEIGSEGGDSLFITSGDTGLKFSSGSDAIIPATTAGAARDNAIDLGSSGARYKDLYLSSGVFLGGTGTANKLTDYEEGTWTPIIKFGGGTTGISATQVGAYTKIGNLVTLQIFIEFSNKGSSTGAATISGIPFTIATLTNSWSGVGTAPLVWHNMASSLVQAGVTVNRSSQLLNLFGHTASNGNGTNQALTNTDFANNSYFGITAAYLST